MRDGEAKPKEAKPKEAEPKEAEPKEAEPLKAGRFAARLRELREAAGLTQAALAAAAGVGASAIARLEQGVRSPTWATALALADALGVPCTALSERPRRSRRRPKIGRPKKRA